MAYDLPVILLAEDDDGHAALVEAALRDAALQHPLVRVPNGQEALDYLFNAGSYAGASHALPLVLLADIGLPGLDGVEVLRRVKADPRTAHLPVVMLTAADDPSEVARCYALRCASYVVKPVDAEAFAEAAHRLGLFISLVQTPRTVA